MLHSNNAPLGSLEDKKFKVMHSTHMFNTPLFEKTTKAVISKLNTPHAPDMKVVLETCIILFERQCRVGFSKQDQKYRMERVQNRTQINSNCRNQEKICKYMTHLRIFEKIRYVCWARWTAHDIFLDPKRPSTSASLPHQSFPSKCTFQTRLAKIMSTRCGYWESHHLPTD
jgi:hypothetical protein